ncbi:MAG: hypothetical protein ACRD47_14955 [Nitrososphaeraceae archaeon]
MATYGNVSGDIGLNRLKPVRIHFVNKEEQEKGFYSLMVSGMPVNVQGTNQYVVNNMQIKILDREKIQYQID